MPDFREIQDQLIDDFSFLEEWTDKYAYLIDLGKTLEPMPEADKTDLNLIRGCQSRVWLTAEMVDGRLRFVADSDAFISKGLIALLVKVFNGQQPETLLNEKFDLLERIGLHEHLSPNRSNGLANMLKQMRTYAHAYHATKA
jgi:cysteine desulfuration protein SufE